MCGEGPVPTRVRRPDAVHGAERPGERLGRAVAVPNGDIEQTRCTGGELRPASVIRRRRTYSVNGTPASAENIRRRWYSVVPCARANAATSIS